MYKAGILGGIGPESTIVYYRMIIKRFQEKCKTTDLPAIVINSINMMAMGDLITHQRFDKLVDFLLPEIQALERCGVSHAAIASNTPHIVFDELQRRTNLPLISIVKETCKFIHQMRYKRVGVLGTKPTMSSGLYHREATNYGIDIIAPDNEQQEYIHEKYLSELIYKDIRPGTKQEFVKIVRQLRSSAHIDGLILGGTELPFILSQDDFADITVIDSSLVHVESIVSAILNE